MEDDIEQQCFGRLRVTNAQHAFASSGEVYNGARLAPLTPKLSTGIPR